MAFNGLKIVCLCKCVLRGRWLLPVQLPHRSRNQALHCSVKHLGMQWHSQGVQTNLMSPGNTSCLKLGTVGAVLGVCSLWSPGKGSSNPPVKGQRVVQVCSTDYGCVRSRIALYLWVIPACPLYWRHGTLGGSSSMRGAGWAGWVQSFGTKHRLTLHCFIFSCCRGWYRLNSSQPA